LCIMPGRFRVPTESFSSLMSGQTYTCMDCAWGQYQVRTRTRTHTRTRPFTPACFFVSFRLAN
jgi:hypothetical protein